MTLIDDKQREITSGGLGNPTQLTDRLNDPALSVSPEVNDSLSELSKNQLLSNYNVLVALHHVAIGNQACRMCCDGVRFQ